MELTQLRYFLQVYRTGNICGAAAQLNVTQQAVSKQIQKLENELGVELFVRQARGVQATPYAELLASKVQDFLPELDALAYNIQRRDREITGVVRLGIQCWQMGTKQGLRYGVLEDFRRAYPKVHLIWENSTPKRCVEGLLQQELDIAVMLMPEDAKELELTPLCTASWYMLMAKDNPLAERDVLSLEDLEGQRLILANNEAKTRSEIIRALEGREKPVFIGVEDFIFDLLAQQIEGEGALMLTTQTSVGMFNPERFVLVPMKSSIWRTQLYLTRTSKLVRMPAEQALYQFLLERWSEKPQQ